MFLVYFCTLTNFPEEILENDFKGEHKKYCTKTEKYTFFEISKSLKIFITKT